MAQEQETWWFLVMRLQKEKGLEKKKKDASDYNQVATQNMHSIPRGE